MVVVVGGRREEALVEWRPEAVLRRASSGLCARNPSDVTGPVVQVFPGGSYRYMVRKVQPGRSRPAAPVAEAVNGGVPAGCRLGQAVR